MKPIPWDRPIPIGHAPARDRDGRLTIKVVHLPLKLHTLLGGATNSGKSGLVHTFLAGVAQRENVQMVILDPKRVEFPFWQWGARASCIATGTDACRQAIALILAEMHRRYEWCERNRTKLWVPTPDEPWLVVIIDELAELLYKGNTAQLSPLQSILAMGRAAGIFLLSATQRPDVDVIPGTLRDNHRVRICLGTESLDATKMVLGPEGINYPCHTIPETIPGVGWIRVDRQFTKFRGFYLPEKQLEQVIDATAHLRRDIPGFDHHIRSSPTGPPSTEPPTTTAHRGRKTASAGR